MRRTRVLSAFAAAVLLPGFAAQAHENCGCRGSAVLNGQLNTADFDGGVGDRFGDGGTGGGGYVFVGDGASAGSFARGGAFASAHASAFAHASISTHFGGGHGGYGHGGGGWGGGHH